LGNIAPTMPVAGRLRPGGSPPGRRSVVRRSPGGRFRL